MTFPAPLRAENQLFCLKNNCSEGYFFSTPSEHLFSGQNGANLEPCGPILEPTDAEFAEFVFAIELLEIGYPPSVVEPAGDLVSGSDLWSNKAEAVLWLCVQHLESLGS